MPSHVPERLLPTLVQGSQSMFRYTYVKTDVQNLMRTPFPKLPANAIMTRRAVNPPQPSLTSHVTVQSSSASRMNLPSLYFSLASYALSYFQPTVSLHCRQWMSRTTWRPVVMLRSLGSDSVMLTTLSKR